MPVTRLWQEHEERMVRYLLGDVPPAEEAQVEERLFADAAFLEEMMALRDDLVDAYLTGSLSSEDKAKFETYFLASPLGRERVQFIRDVATVSQRATERSVAPGRIAAWLLLAAAVLAALLLTPWLRRNPVRPDEIAVGQTPTPAATSAPVAETRTIRLSAATTEPVDVAVAANTETVRLEAPVPDVRRPSYRAALIDADGATIWSAPRLVPTAAGEPLVMAIPARLMVAAAYTLRLEGERLRGEEPRPAATLRYTLRIQRQSP